MSGPQTRPAGEVFHALTSFPDTSPVRELWEHSDPNLLEGPEGSLGSTMATPPPFSPFLHLLLNTEFWTQSSEFWTPHRATFFLLRLGLAKFLALGELESLDLTEAASWLLDLNDFFPQKEEVLL